MTYRECILDGKRRLEAARLECADPLLHMKQIVEASLGIDSGELLRRWEEEVGSADAELVEKALLRRTTGEPFQYIFGFEWFWNSKFLVGPGVLIPRPETEILVEKALREIPRKPVRIAELGAGTGIIGITLLLERPEWEWFACESNPDSWPYWEQNQKLLPPTKRYHGRKGDFFAGVGGEGPFDWFVSNPPYVKRGELAGLSREVRNEPAAALDGGESGLDVVKQLVSLGSKILASGGGILLEIGSDQGSEVLALLEQAGFQQNSIEKDLAGRDRVAYGRKK